MKPSERANSPAGCPRSACGLASLYGKNTRMTNILKTLTLDHACHGEHLQMCAGRTYSVLCRWEAGLPGATAAWPLLHDVRYKCSRRQHDSDYSLPLGRFERPAERSMGFLK